MSSFNSRAAPDENANVFGNSVGTGRSKNVNHGRAVAKANEHAAAAANVQRTAAPANDPVADEVRSLQTRVKKRDKENTALLERVAKLEKELQESRAREAGAEVDDPPKAIYDPSEGVDRCTECAWEVVEGFCENCQKEHEGRLLHYPLTKLILTEIVQVDEDEDQEPKDSLLIDTTYDSDREQAPRSTTPLLTIPRVLRPLPGYSYDHYEALLQRGATRLMIETFNLEFCQDKGIFAWADCTLYKEFAGPKMLKGDFWKIQLGRRFDLDEDDLDGSGFIEGILEEAVMFPGKGGDGAQWETVEESPGIWFTRMVKAANENEEDSQEGDEKECGEEDGEEDDEEQGDEGGEENDEDMGEKVDELKDEPVFVDDGPVRTCPGYDTSDDRVSDIEQMEVDGTEGTESSDDVDMVDDPSTAIRANIPDDLYDAGDTDEDIEDAPQFVADVIDQAQVNLNEADMDDPELNTLYYEDFDSADSDFDEDETLSGDEEVLQQPSGLGWWLKH